jgi:hypothetical protein
MVYAVPLSDGSFCFAQAVVDAMTNVIDIAVFRTRLDKLPSEPPNLERSDLISLSATWRQALNRGDWAALGITTPAVDRLDCPNQKLIESGTTVGIRTSDPGIIEGLLNAWFGLEPWNVMYKDDYYDAMLAPGVTRPASALVLSQTDRVAYRAKRISESETA